MIRTSVVVEAMDGDRVEFEVEVEAVGRGERGGRSLLA